MNGHLCDDIKSRIAKDVLVRLNAFLLSYFGWMFFSILYIYIGRWSVDVTEQFIKLPFNSRDFILTLLNTTKSIPPVYHLLNAVYYIGFAGSIAFMVLYVLIYLKDFQTSDELLARYFIAYATAGAIYLTFHIYAPHYVYNVPGYDTDNLFTRQEFVLPSLHNTFAAIHIITIWKYRKRLGGKVLLTINTLIPFATVLLIHHWIYDVLAGFLLAWAISSLTDGWMAKIPRTLYQLEIRSLSAVTLLNFLLAALLLLFSLEPQKWILLFRALLNQP
ncbi:phosphatase PAP2 family protein [Thermococcus kodakarensis]|nr:phosphatase PAP2 family protein [Thermococcus kodakarensis]WCN28436.1 phosphatase PAP2 family protein [Thermococcus kodakarensis]WCN30732.1 phosphatase PAP2 family protein [Thermococcus kodakarensis]